tara:strand:+ start:636 stop:911 length:276 start_codon:yes stop_codon:yes gene_type:complete
MAIISKVNSYPVINIAVEEKETFVVDKRFLDIFLGQFTKVTLSEMKEQINHIVDCAENPQDLVKGLDEHLYLHKVANHPNLANHFKSNNEL